MLPLASYSLSAGFGLTGPLWEAEHGGQDFGSYVGDQIVAVAAGVVTEVAYAGPYGLRTIVTLPDGTEVWYCHQDDVSVYTGQAVDVADPIGTVGSTGNSTGPHLHLEVRPGAGSPIDPMDWLRGSRARPLALALLARLLLDHDRRADEAELLAEPALDEALVGRRPACRW